MLHLIKGYLCSISHSSYLLHILGIQALSSVQIPSIESRTILSLVVGKDLAGEEGVVLYGSHNLILKPLALNKRKISYSITISCMRSNV